MRELVVISGKGGTGKTSITAALAHLAQNKVLCDLDVDAPDLHLLLDPKIDRSMAFLSGHQADIDLLKCQACGKCLEMCRFGAIKLKNKQYSIDSSHCEGCKVCVTFCPEKAIDFPERLCGTWYESSTRFGPMIHALLTPGQENSGKLVSLLKNRAREKAGQLGLDLVLSDGAPGIGCPVISSLSQASLALIVTEPTPSGLHDLKRVTDLCKHFRVACAVLINKADLSEIHCIEIRLACDVEKVPVIAELPFDPEIVQAMLVRQTITEYSDGALSRQIRQAWTRLESLLNHR